MTKVDVNLINGIALAFEGDAIYSTYIRKHLIFQGMTKPNPVSYTHLTLPTTERV